MNSINPTENFIVNTMVNHNGTFATYLKENDEQDSDLVKGKESISESLGLWLQYAVEKKDEELFRQGYLQLEGNFMNDEGLIYWKLDPSGKKLVTTNALVDDLRIIEALCEAGELWKEERYEETATTISQYLLEHNRNEELLVDYYDETYQLNSKMLTLSYINTSALEEMKKRHLVDVKLYENMMKTLNEIPSQNGFYAKSYDVVNKKYLFDEQINMIDQMIIALHQAEDGMKTDSFYLFLKNQFLENGVIYGRYTRETHMPSVTYESPSVYGFAILYCLEIGDEDFAESLYRRMIAFREKNKDNQFYGGYSINSKGDTHIFDNLVPLLAEETLVNQGVVDGRHSQ
ncbi:MAG: glycosyl hydrolase family 8 [Anaerobacillus sp.]